MQKHDAINIIAIQRQNAIEERSVSFFLITSTHFTINLIDLITFAIISTLKSQIDNRKNEQSNLLRRQP